MALCTVVIPVHNQLEYTRLCLESVFRYTDIPFHLLIVDNGSTDGTAEFLRDIRSPGPYLGRLSVLTNPENAGVARSWNQGIAAAAEGPVCLINNDIVVTRGWLRNLLGFLLEFPHFGIAGAHVTDGPIPPGYDEWAARYVAQHWRITHDGFHGCCFMLSREVIERVGPFDERFEIGVWEDVDYQHRARLAGFSPTVTHRTVVHHFGSKTISSVVAGLGGRNLYMENLRRFTEKWGITLGNFRVSRSMLINE